MCSCLLLALKTTGLDNIFYRLEEAVSSYEQNQMFTRQVVLGDTIQISRQMKISVT